MAAKKRSRNSDATRTRIIDAVGEVLRRDGFRAVGINTIARRAGVDKVLIYRYFGSLPELLKVFAGQSMVWPTVDELLTGSREAFERRDPVEAATELLLGHVRALRERPMTMELMRWELLEQNELTVALAQAREEQGTILFERFFQQFGDLDAEYDLPAVCALLLSGLTYLLLRSHTAAEYMGVPINQDEGFTRLENVVRQLVAVVLTGRQGSAFSSIHTNTQ